MKVGLIVEDYYAGAMKEICRRINVNPEIRRQRGRISVRKASSYAKELLYECEKVIILADEDAISKFLGRNAKVKAIANPEGIHDAKEYLDEIFKKAGKTYFTRVAEGIAYSANVDKIVKKSSSFEDFRNKAEDCYV